MKNYLKATGSVFMLMFTMASCTKDNSNAMETESYNTTFKMTDAPIDNAAVKAVFVTVANVKIDGKPLEGFSKTTFNLSALVNGQTKTLGNLDLQSKSYSNIALEMDYDADASGNAPGCYVELANGEKDKLTSSSKEIVINSTFEVLATASNEVVIDFDLRKTIKEETGATANFEFVTKNELSAGVRAVNEELTGEISGTANDAQNTSDKIVVYAYKKGTYNAETETSGQGDSNVTFANAVTSAEVSGVTGNYSLNFLAEGDYELVYASYKKNADNGDYYFNAMLNAESTTGLNLGAISVTSAIQISANVTITGTK